MLADQRAVPELRQQVRIVEGQAQRGRVRAQRIVGRDRFRNQVRPRRRDLAVALKPNTGTRGGRARGFPLFPSRVVVAVHGHS